MTGKPKAQTTTTKANSFYSPLGSYDSGKGSYDSPMFAWNMPTMQLANEKIRTATQSLPTSFDPNSYFNNQFYDNTKQMLSNPILRQYSQDTQDLENNLSARNQGGSSFEALMRRNLMQGRDYNLNQAELQGRQTSAEMYGKGIDQNLATISGLSGMNTNLLNQIYYPAQMANGFGNTSTSPVAKAGGAGSGIGSALGTLAGIALAAPTGGMSIPAGAAIGGAVGGGAGSAFNR